MVASGGNVSASVYKPAVAFLSSGIINVILTIVLPLIALMIIFNTLSNFSSSIKLEKFSELGASIIKWIIGLIVAVFGIFLSVQGITSATFDGISIKATKFAISNSIPLVGGFLKDGFDLVVAGSILIKNAIGSIRTMPLLIKMITVIFIA
jgi:stage III sporulation protein AE